MVDVERMALYNALSALLDTGALEAVTSFFENNHLLSLRGSHPLTHSQIEDALFQYFREGSKLIMAEYDKKFNELTSTDDTIA